MSGETKTKVLRVQPGENQDDFLKRAGCDLETLVKLNGDGYLGDRARARGFEPTFRRGHPDEVRQGGGTVEYHLFAGEELRVPDTESDDKQSERPTYNE